MSLADKFILAIDLGTSGPKVALFSIHGELVGREFEETHLFLHPDGGAEQSPSEWWHAIQKAQAIARSGHGTNEEIVRSPDWSMIRYGHDG
jgi:sugar (pentulose or hexulose) kinase